MIEATSRERMLRALDRRDTSYIPCCFMSFTALRRRLKEDMFALAEAELAMGLDSMLFIPVAPRPQRLDHPDLRGLPVRFRPEVTVREWSEAGDGGSRLLHKEIHTPAGVLTTSVQLSEDWPHGEHIPFVDDYQVPRAIKHLVSEPEDLGPLEYLLAPPSEEDAWRFRQEAETARAFAARHGVLLAGGWGVGMDMLNWLCGMQSLMMLAIDRPRMVADLLEMVHRWNMRRMEVVLSAPVDLFIRRAWYEGCDFVTRAFFRHEILPRLKVEVAMAHDRGARFGYICSSGLKPMLDFYLESGIDALIGIDPVQGTQTDMPLLRRKLGGRICLWGGVSGAVTVEMGTQAEVRTAVREAIQTLGPDGFILSPVDNITIDEPKTWRNIDVFIDEWRRNREVRG